MRASFAGNSNYDPASDTKTIVIDKADAVGRDHLGDAADLQQLDPSGDRGCERGRWRHQPEPGSNARVLRRLHRGGAAGTGTVTAPTNAGTHTVRASFAGNSNYDPASDTKTIVIDKADASARDHLGDAADLQQLDPSGDRGCERGRWRHQPEPGSNARVLRRRHGGGGGHRHGDRAPTNAGTHTVRASFAGNSNYNPASDTKTIVIDKADASVVITWATPQTYNSSTHPATAVVNGVGGDTNLSPAATLEYFAGATAGAAGTGTATAPTNAGTYTVRASFAGNSNYNPASDTKTIVIDKADASVVITWATPQTYNSSTHPATAVVNGVGGETNLSPAATLEYFSRLDRGGGRAPARRPHRPTLAPTRCGPRLPATATTTRPRTRRRS